MTLENRHHEYICFYYQVNYTLTEVPEDAAYFHARFRRTNPLPYKEVYTIADGIRGRGHYVGTAMAWGVNSNGWWGEGEIKFYMDGDGDFPTICGTGTEDYFGGAYDWDVDGEYVTYSAPFMGMHLVIQPDGLYRSQQRFAMYRWHVMDPVRFERDLRVDDSGPRGPRRRTLGGAARRYGVGCLLVPDTSHHPVSSPARQGLPGNHLSLRGGLSSQRPQQAAPPGMGGPPGAAIEP